MAATAEARELTAAHQVAQARIGARAAVRAHSLWSLMDLTDLDASAGLWAPMYVGMLQQERTASVRLAAAYTREMRRLQPTRDEGLILARPFNHAQAFVTARVAGPVTAKSLIGRGVPPEKAVAVAQRATVGRAQRWTMEGGRQVVMDSARQSWNRRWRIVTEANPCAFCALMAIRTFPWTGAAIYRGQPVFDSHAHCRCTVEEVFADQDETTDLEDELIDAYLEAARAADAAGEPRRGPKRGHPGNDTIVWRMRRLRPDLFSDGIRGSARVP